MLRSMTTSGLICLQDDYNFIYKIARIDFTEWEDGHFKYSFYPFYSVIDMLPPHLFQGIPGLDLSLREACYERENIVPVFISERTPSENREDLWRLLEDSGMDALNRLKWLIRTNKRYSGDRFFVRPLDEVEVRTIRLPSMYDLGCSSNRVIERLLEIICYGDCLYCDEITINNETRAQHYRLLMPMFIRNYNDKRNARLDGIRRAANNNAYHGRAPIDIDPLLFDKIARAYLNRDISVEEATERLGISRSTFFRRLRKFDS